MKKVVIIGGGIAGISAGIYARKAGFDTEIYEKNSVAGGQCMGWNRKNHHIDNCIHWLTGTKKDTDLYNIWKEVNALGNDIEMIEIDQFYTSALENRSITFSRDLEKTRQELIALSKEDEIEINKFIDYVKLAQCCEMPVEKPMDMMNLFDYIKLGKSMSDLPKVMKEYSKITIEELSKRFKDPLLQKAFSDFMPPEYLASYFIISYATMSSGNGNIPEGGSLALVNRIIDKYKSLDGKLYLNKTVKKVAIENKVANKIILEDGSSINADYIICSTDTFETFNKIIGKEYQSKKWQEYYNIKNYNALSGFQVAVSVDRNLINLENSIFFDCEAFKVSTNTVSRLGLKSYHYEKNFAPSNKVVLQVNILQYLEDYNYWSTLSKDDYSKVKNDIAQQIVSRIIKKYPALKDHIDILDIWTPLTYNRYCNSYKGAYMSFNAKVNNKAVNESGIIKKLNNVFLAGQWLQGPGGLPAALSTGKFAIQYILKKEGRSYKI